MDGEDGSGVLVGRRRALALAAATAAAAIGGLRPATARRSDGLAARAARAGLTFGSSVAAEVDTDPAYAALYRDETAIVTTDYALKFDVLRPDASTFRFEPADRLLAFAKGAGLAFRGHALIWNENVPGWVKTSSAAAVERVMAGHIERVASHYAGRVHSWDVVNEPFWPGHGIAGGFRDGPWFRAMGQRYVAEALRRIAAVDPKARLLINEAFTEHADDLGLAVRAGLLKLVDDLRQKGVPLHGIGLQGHLDMRKPPDDEGFRTFLHELARRDLDIWITELDVNDSALSGRVETRDIAVAARVAGFLAAVLAEPRVRGVITWQLSDRYSWYRDPAVARSLSPARPMRPLPFDDRMDRKPMWQAIAAAFEARRRT